MNIKLANKTLRLLKDVVCQVREDVPAESMTRHLLDALEDAQDHLVLLRKLQEDTNYQDAVELYEQGGADAVERAALTGELLSDGWKWCDPCDGSEPYWDGACLVCGTVARETTT